MKKIFLDPPQASGVYEILNKKNGKKYFGQAARLNARAHQHEKALNAGKHGNKHLQSAWNLYGSEAFEFRVIQLIQERTGRDVLEQQLITEWYGEMCYNIQKEVNVARKVWSLTPEQTKKRLSEKRKDWKHSDESKAKTSASMKGKNVGKIKSPEARAKISAAKKAYWAALKKI